MKKTFILLLALTSVALLAGCGGPKKISASDAAKQISEQVFSVLKRSGFNPKSDGSPSLSKDSQKALASVQDALAKSGSTRTETVDVEIVIPIATTAPVYERVSNDRVLTDADAFNQARALARQNRLNDLDAPDTPMFIRQIAPIGHKGKLLYTARAELRLNHTEKRIAIDIRDIVDADMEGFGDNDIMVVEPHMVIIDTPAAAAALKARADYIAAVDAKVKEAVAMSAAKQKEQEERAAAMDAAVAKAVEGFNGRYNVQLTQKRDGAKINLTFYFSVNENGEKVANFTTVGDARNLERSFKIVVNERRAQKTFTEDGTARAAVEAKASSLRTGYNARDARDYPAFFRSSFSLELTSDTGNPGLLKVSGSFEGVAKRAE